MDEYPKMIFKFPSTLPDPSELEDGFYDTTIVESKEDEDAKIADGWYLTSPEAKEGKVWKAKK
jgi:hypothetical protein